jgi:ATP-dependent Clp protease ATP-binding subunit ClpB
VDLVLLGILLKKREKKSVEYSLKFAMRPTFLGVTFAAMFMKTAVMQIVGQHFRPEFINRIDESVVFHSLNREQIRSIASIQLQQLNQRLNNYDMQLQASDAVLDRIAEVGFNPIYGARPLKRAIQQEIANPLSQRLLAGDFVSGDTIHADLDNGQIVFQ